MIFEIRQYNDAKNEDINVKTNPIYLFKVSISASVSSNIAGGCEIKVSPIKLRATAKNNVKLALVVFKQ